MNFKFDFKKFLWGIKWSLITYLVIITISIPALIYLSIGLPSLDEIERYRAPNSTKVYDINGKLIYEFHEERRVPTRIDKLPKHVIMSFILLEDRKFYKHWGVDIDRVIKAMIKNILTFSIREGASTITQQLARNMFLTQERTLTRKIREILLAIKLERTFSKDEILERYLNQIYMGSGLYGIENASQYYFGKSASDLNPKESAILAGIPKNPSRYSPTKNYNLALERANIVLKMLYNYKVITKTDYEKYKKYKPEIVYHKSPVLYGGIAPYFIDEVRKYIESKYGEEFLFRGGGKIYTTLNSRIQEICNKVLDSMLNVYDMKFPTRPKYKDYNPKSNKKPNYLQGAVIVLDNKTGYVLAMIGGRNYLHSQFNRATQAYRQAGSAFKIFTYASAIEKGYNASDIIYDLPISIKLSDNSVWQPSNYDREYDGAIPIWKAVALSKNLATVRLLMDIGPASASEMAKRLGIETPVPPYYSVALGSIDIRPIELVNAFSTIASYGSRKKIIFITKVEDANGIILEENKPQYTQVLDSISAYLTINLLKHVLDAGTAIDARLIYKFNEHAAGKTGTTDDYRDAWFIGFTPDITVGVWVGYDSTRTIFPNATSTYLAVPIWSLIMKEIYKDKSTKDFYIPYGVEFRKVCRVSGKLPTRYCPIIYEPFRTHKEPTETCDVHTKENTETKIEEQFFKDLIDNQ
ncbi:MAG: PBP1A family penicillin-binding protein [candidate division WOR-3 bacterium]|nr:PBP1A family penicillin-binding protein [candidate division WOR-3 bacterium]MCX7947586.1 PBP1A family penicillin-binding protein [candidate division WOR-3 bacterium]MDW8150471.1 PBP1A family penicillin-binding protein [candidate division WOR-3 bacterium]